MKTDEAIRYFDEKYNIEQMVECEEKEFRIAIRESLEKLHKIEELIIHGREARIESKDRNEYLTCKSITLTRIEKVIAE